jgi:hypothetical protein
MGGANGQSSKLSRPLVNRLLRLKYKSQLPEQPKKFTELIALLKVWDCF